MIAVARPSRATTATHSIPQGVHSPTLRRPCMKIRLAAHLTCAAVCLGLLFADQGRLASVLYFLYLGVEVFISAVTGKQRNDGER
ncbi:MAG: hypothetical protein C0470_15020 [Verminephrobacter sp.]|nr:hypothetical protein [Verminephrobacter sp.]